MFITPAYADTTAGTVAATDVPAGAASILSPPTLLAAILLLAFYIIIIRPQNKRFQEHRDMVKNLQKGDKVVTGGGFIATVKKVVSDDEIVLELAEGVQVTALRSTIMSKKV